MPENLNCSYTYASFRIWGKYLDARAVTERLGIIPSTSFQRGDPGGPKGNWRRGFWAITTRRDRFNEATLVDRAGTGDVDTGQSLAEGELSSTDLQQHIEWLLERLDPVREDLLAIMAEPGIHADITCYWESATGHGGPVFTSVFLRRFSEFNLLLGISFFDPGTESGLPQ